MFNGIIAKIGLVVFIERTENGCMIGIKILNSNALDESVWKLKHGDSVACDGICLTVVKVQEDTRHGNSVFFVQAAAETMTVTNVRAWNVNKTLVNLERPLKIGDFLDGYFVSGHVDCTVNLLEKREIPNDGGTIMVFFKPEKLARYIVPKGSITLNGVALTVNDVDSETFSVCIIPYTAEHTNLSKITANDDLINLEIDMLARYVVPITS